MELIISRTVLSAAIRIKKIVFFLIIEIQIMTSPFTSLATTMVAAGRAAGRATGRATGRAPSLRSANDALGSQEKEFMRDALSSPQHSKMTAK